MNVTDLVYIDSTGYHFADFPAFQSWLQGVYQGIYGADVYLGADSQDGQFLNTLAQAFLDTAAVGASTFNSFAPPTAQGVGLSRVVKINGIKRNIPSFSTVTLTIVGTADTVIVNGIAQDALGQQWFLPVSVTIPGGGSINVTATAALVGSVFGDIGTITTIFTPTNGWQTVNNAAAAVPGTAVESDPVLRVRQAQSTELPALTVLDATVAAIANLPGVTKIAGFENDTVSTDANGIPANTVCFVVAGGVQADIAQAIQVKKTPGTGTFGNVSTLVYDSRGMPLTVKYQTAVTAEIQVTVNLTKAAGWSDDFIVLIQNAVAALINSLPIGGIGQNKIIYYTTLFPAAYLNGTVQGQTFDITSLTMGKNGGMQSAANVSLNFDELSVCDPATDVTVVAV